MFTVLDKSNYLKALLIVARIDKKLYEAEKNYIRDIAKRLGFSRDFYEDTLRTLLVNDNIKNDPVVFSSRHIAELFMFDALELAYSDGRCGKEEMDYLAGMARANEIPEERLNEVLSHFKGTSIFKDAG